LKPLASSPKTPPPPAAARASLARERILDTAYQLFCRGGIQSVGVDLIVSEAGVAKTTLYHHFRSKDDLVVAALARRSERWTRGWLIVEAERRAKTPGARLLAVFDAFDDWFRRADYEGCLFANTLIERHDRDGPVGAAASAGLAEVRAYLSSLALEAGVDDPDAFAVVWQALLLGSIVAAVEGNRGVAVQTRHAAALLLESALGT
jgi:AcrR family transcriptional regulator